MEDSYYKYGETIEIENLTNQRAIEFTKAVQKHNYANVRKAVRVDKLEGVEFDVYPEIPQHPSSDIKKAERICVVFPENSNKQPNVLALRKDFPVDLQHLNLTSPDEPKSLCLFEQDYREIKATGYSHGLVEQQLMSNTYLTSL